MSPFKILSALGAVRAAREAADRLKKSLIWAVIGGVFALIALIIGAIALALGVQLLLPDTWPLAAGYGIVAGGLLLIAVICFLVSGQARKAPAGTPALTDAATQELAQAARMTGEAVGASAADLSRSANDLARSAKRLANSPKGRITLLAAALIAGLAASRKL